MAIMVIFNGPDMTKEQYDSLRPIVQWETNQPEGLIMHSCAFDEPGGLHVVDLWESPEQAQSFFQNRLRPGFDQLNISAPPPEIHTVHNINAYPGIENHKL